jgi:hypothetical protein
MNVKLLDNPAWYALNSHHRHLAIWGNIAARYQPGTLISGAMPFLHVKPTNDIAIKLYKKLGFRIRKKIDVAMIKREA